LTSALLVGARMQWRVNNSRRLKLSECFYRISAAIWIPVRVSRYTANGCENLNSSSA
jgi:hypothetical protein